MSRAFRSADEKLSSSFEPGLKCTITPSPFHPQPLKRLLGALNEFLTALYITLSIAGKEEETVGFLGACILDHVIVRQKLVKGSLEACLCLFVLTLGLVDTSLPALTIRW